MFLSAQGGADLGCLYPSFALHPRLRAFRSRLSIVDALYTRGFIFPSRFQLCSAADENLQHLFLEYPFVRDLWDAVSSAFGHRLYVDGSLLDL